MSYRKINLLYEYVFPRLVLDIVLFYLTLLALATIVSLAPIDAKWFALATSSYLMTIFSFVYNDIEDAQDDAKSMYKYIDPVNHLLLALGIKNRRNTGGKRFRNPFSYGEISPRSGYITLFLLGILSLLLGFTGGGSEAALVVFTSLMTGLAYSHNIIRLKSRPLLDLLSHSYLLAGSQILLFVVSYQHFRLETLIVLLGAMIYSIGSDLENEYRDFEDDRLSSIINTSTIIGKTHTKYLSALLRFTSIFILLAAFF